MEQINYYSVKTGLVAALIIFLPSVSIASNHNDNDDNFLNRMVLNKKSMVVDKENDADRDRAKKKRKHNSGDHDSDSDNHNNDHDE